MAYAVCGECGVCSMRCDVENCFRYQTEIENCRIRQKYVWEWIDKVVWRVENEKWWHGFSCQVAPISEYLKMPNDSIRRFIKRWQPWLNHKSQSRNLLHSFYAIIFNYWIEESSYNLNNWSWASASLTRRHGEKSAVSSTDPTSTVISPSCNRMKRSLLNRHERYVHTYKRSPAQHKRFGTSMSG